MRRVVLVLSIGLLAGLPVLAQRGGGGHGGGGGMRGGGGGGMRGGGMGGMRGGFGGGGFRGGGFRGGGFGRGFGGFRGGFGRFDRFNRFNRFNSLGFFSPFGFGFPAFFAGYGLSDWPLDYGYPYDYSYPYNYGYPNGGYQSAEPQVIIVQQTPNAYSYAQPEPAAPVVREYVAPAPSQTSYEPPLYLIAFQDASIRAALAYWAEGSTLRYVTMDHEQKQAPLASVDRALSERLNRERNVQFRLPSPPPAR